MIKKQSNFGKFHDELKNYLIYILINKVIKGYILIQIPGKDFKRPQITK